MHRTRGASLGYSISKRQEKQETTRGVSSPWETTKKPPPWKGCSTKEDQQLSSPPAARRKQPSGMEHTPPPPRRTWGAPPADMVPPGPRWHAGGTQALGMKRGGSCPLPPPSSAGLELPQLPPNGCGSLREQSSVSAAHGTERRAAGSGWAGARTLLLLRALRGERKEPAAGSGLSSEPLFTVQLRVQLRVLREPRSALPSFSRAPPRSLWLCRCCFLASRSLRKRVCLCFRWK